MDLMRHIPYKSNLSKWNKNIVSHTYTAHSTQSSTYTLAITLIPPSTKHTSKYQIERNKVVARDKCLRANDLSLLFFEFFFHFFSTSNCSSWCCFFTHPFHKLSFALFFGAYAMENFFHLHSMYFRSLWAVLCVFCFSSLCPVTQYTELKSRLNRIRNV